MPHPDRIVVDTISVSPVDSRGNRGEQRYWRAKKGREYLGAQWATRTEARAWALALAQEDLGIAPAGATNVVDLTGLLEAWWEVTETDPLLKAKTTQSYRYSLQHLDDAGGGEKLAGMDVDAMKRIVSVLRSKGYAFSTIGQDLRVLSIAWNWALRRRPPLVRHPLPSLDLPDEGPTNNNRTPTADEIERAIAHARGNTRTAMLLMYATGARQSEVCGLSWEQVNFDDGIVTITGKRKRRSSALPTVRQVALGEGLLDHLRRLRLSGQRSPVTADTVGAQILAACGRAGVPPITPHGIRRHVVDRLYAETDPKTASEILGHSEKEAMKHYRRVRRDDSKAALKATGLMDYRPADVLPFPHRGNSGGTDGR